MQDLDLASTSRFALLRGRGLGLAALLLGLTFGTGACTKKAGIVPVDSPVYAFTPPDEEDVDTDTDDTDVPDETGDEGDTVEEPAPAPAPAPTPAPKPPVKPAGGSKPGGK